jgi:hypothetical protein
MKIMNPQTRALMAAIEATLDEELDCEGFLTVMARYVEQGAPSVASPPALVAAAAHERLCANCREEAEALRTAINETSDDA